MLKNLKVALVHDWLNGMRGGEKVLEVFCELFPSADLYTLLYEKNKISKKIQAHSVQTSFIERLPGAHQWYRYYLPLFPLAIEKMSLAHKDYDLVISTSHCVAKGIIPPKKAWHLCYCFTPMRYAWALQEEYLGKGLKRLIAAPILSALRAWDKKSSHRVDQFVGISNYVAERINRYYKRPADVIYPPVETNAFSPAPKEGSFLVLSALVPYKRVDLAIEAFNELKLPLTIIGAGNVSEKLKAQAGETITFLGWQSDEAVAEHLAKARALIFPGEEDFGIVPLEALASATPVIAYGKGGVLETILPLKEQAPSKASGLFFEEQTKASLVEAIERFLKIEGEFDPQFLRAEAENFNRDRFKQEIQNYIQEKYESSQMA